MFHNKRLLFPYCFWKFCNLIIPRQGIEMQILFLNGLWRFLKNGHLLVKLHSSASPPPPPPSGPMQYVSLLSFLNDKVKITFQTKMMSCHQNSHSLSFARGLHENWPLIRKYLRLLKSSGLTNWVVKNFIWDGQ